ncbi:uncharacterized protein BXZ73DRAFT_73442 [Epithele typhae]|uniref:uncharacterized protein n=1 Tax=Epithele typhae TaxID=378194 RepID=UPI002008DC90|nr:uncharacterized protein BXZ73DRAFT_73442 [Epithele typhae]KAH9945281.1 hypothetical protein BXZ73DRAFT_73442 [Epithele typhae]
MACTLSSTATLFAESSSSACRNTITIPLNMTPARTFKRSLSRASPRAAPSPAPRASSGAESVPPHISLATWHMSSYYESFPCAIPSDQLLACLQGSPSSTPSSPASPRQFGLPPSTDDVLLSPRGLKGKGVALGADEDEEMEDAPRTRAKQQLSPIGAQRPSFEPTSRPSPTGTFPTVQIQLPGRPGPGPVRRPSPPASRASAPFPAPKAAAVSAAPPGCRPHTVSSVSPSSSPLAAERQPAPFLPPGLRSPDAPHVTADGFRVQRPPHVPRGDEQASDLDAFERRFVALPRDRASIPTARRRRGPYARKIKEHESTGPGTQFGPLPCASFYTVDCRCGYCARRRRAGALLQARMTHTVIGRRFAELRHDDAQWQYEEPKGRIRALHAGLLIKKQRVAGGWP